MKKSLKENQWQCLKDMIPWPKHYLTRTETRVLGYLLHNYQRGFIDLKQFTAAIINKKIKLSRPKIIESLKSLEKKGFIARVRSEKTGKKTNYYRLRLL